MTVMPAGDLSVDDPLLSTKKVGEMFDVKPETIRDWIKQGKIAGVQINRSWRVRRSVAIAFGNARYGDGVAATPADAPEAADGAAEPVPGACSPDCPVLHADPAYPLHPRFPAGGGEPVDCRSTDHPHPGGLCKEDA